MCHQLIEAVGHLRIEQVDPPNHCFDEPGPTEPQQVLRFARLIENLDEYRPSDAGRRQFTFQFADGVVAVDHRHRDRVDPRLRTPL